MIRSFRRPAVGPWFAALAAVAICLATAPSARAADLNKLKHSQWDSNYSGDGVDGNQHAFVYFNGPKALFRVKNGNTVTLKGKMSDVHYKVDTDNGGYVITGNWDAQGTTGTFEFDVTDDGKSFTGSWQTDDGSQSGDWSGNAGNFPFIP